MRRILNVCILLLFAQYTISASNLKQTDLKTKDRKQVFSVTYKKIGNVKLDLTFRYPKEFKKSKKYPTIIFFYGGGWNSGSIKQFEPQAKYFVSRGMITVLADYRVKYRQHTTPYEAVSDAKSAIRFLREHAKELNINKNKIAASGGSAGAHMAAACANCKALDEPNENLKISSKPNALVLFNPVIDNGPGGYGHKTMGNRWKEISPMHNITKGAVPTAIFLGTHDHFIPVATVKKYKAKMDAVGSRCDLFLYEGVDHGFFNIEKHNGKYYKKTICEADKFLESLGYVKKANHK